MITLCYDCNSIIYSTTMFSNAKSDDDNTNNNTFSKHDITKANFDSCRGKELFTGCKIKRYF